MPSLSLLDFGTLVQNSCAAAQASCSRLLNFTVGSVLRAIMEANASVALWMQYLIVQVWLGCRLVTSAGPDVDSFVGDYGLTRLAAVPATGNVTFSRFNAASSALIPLGAVVKTADGSLSFTVTLDSSNALWSAQLNGYLLAAGTLSAVVPVEAQPDANGNITGTAGNVQIGAISLIATAISGLDTVTNTAPFTNGADAETDTSLKARFVSYIASLARATKGAVENAITSTEQGLTYVVQENMEPDGTAHPGFFTVVVDDGTGNPGDALLAAVAASIEQVRPIGSSYTVQAPQIVNVVISMTITAASGYVKATLQGQVQNAIVAYVNGLGVGNACSYTRLSAIAYGIAGVANVSSVLLNNGSQDVGGGPKQTCQTTSASVAIN